MSVYLIRAGKDGPVKIGHAREPSRRLANLQLGSAEPLILIGVRDGAEEEERRIHQRFAGDHLRAEWFRFNEAMLEEFTHPVESQIHHTRYVTPSNTLIRGYRPAIPTDAIKILCLIYCEAQSVSVHAVGASVGKPKLFKRLFAGKGCHIDTLGEARLWFAANWPDDLPWPRSIERPAVPETSECPPI